MVKLKNLILEWEDEYGERHPKISTMEEQYALTLIRKYLVPKAVEKYNIKSIHWRVPPLNVDEIRKFIRKLKVENFTNGQEILYSVRADASDLLFSIQKLAHRKVLGDSRNENVFEVGYWDHTCEGWGNFQWVRYPVNKIGSGLEKFEF